MKPTLLILAAGLGSRYGSMKQTESFGPNGETITDYSIYDAMQAGFGRILFVISPAMEDEFRSSYIKKFPVSFDIDYVTQSVNNVPSGIEISPERKKPWGTAHAVLMAAQKVNEPFAVINADDFYGRSSYQMVAEYLTSAGESEYEEFCMAGYLIEKTLSDHGSVSRGICEVDEHNFLTRITERTKIERKGEEIVFKDEEDKEQPVNEGTLVSMNLFGFTPGIFPHLKRYFDSFIRVNSENPKAEIYLPIVVQNMINEKLARTRVLKTSETWFGVTYREDRPTVLKMISDLVEKKVYPSPLW